MEQLESAYKFAYAHDHVVNDILDVVTLQISSSLLVLAVSCFKEVNFKLFMTYIVFV